jgi:hypothetical protein
MKSFSYFLVEQADESKLKHIHHAEDRPLLHGSAGFDHAVGALEQAHNHIKSGAHSSALTMKYDGSPSIIFGRNPENNKFFVASKSAFNKNPKINYTHQDILKNHGHAPGLMDKLHDALNHLPKVTPKVGVYQGDMMFSGDDKQENKRGVSFTPNTITYSAKGNLADKIKRAKVGVVVHQQYHGDTLNNMKADPYPDVHNFTQHPDVWHQSAEHDTRHVHYDPIQQSEFQNHIDAAKKIHKENPMMYSATSPHQGDAGHLATYINQTVRTDEKPNVKGFIQHMKDKYTKAASGLKTPAAQSRKMNQYAEHENYVNANKKHYENLLGMHNHLQQAKNVLVNVLNQHSGGLEHDIDGKKTDPEGFVVNHAGQPTKLVNRAEFSKANLLKARK